MKSRQEIFEKVKKISNGAYCSVSENIIYSAITKKDRIEYEIFSSALGMEISDISLEDCFSKFLKLAILFKKFD